LTCTFSGFTIIELAVTVLIVAILAAVLTPMLQRRVNEARWTEGRTGAGALATGIRTYCSETGRGHPAIPPGGSFSDYRVYEVDLRGRYFQPEDYSVSEVVYNQDTGMVSYLITITTPTGLTGPDKTLDQNGRWSDNR
jgi:prepilin-type N-terminal cleavage/methylation domain-containing protein